MITAKEIALFKCLETELQHKAPNAIVAAKALASAVVDPATSSPDDCWRVIWDKPLFANTNVTIGNRNVTALIPLMHKAWQTVGAPGSTFVVTHTGKGMKVKIPAKPPAYSGMMAPRIPG